jgi:hypothetical protein
MVSSASSEGWPVSEFSAFRKRTLYMLSVAAGLLLGGIYTLAPLMVWALVAAAVVWRLAGRGLPESERRMLATTLAIAFALRLLAIGALVVAGAVRHADPSLGAILTGDEAYVLSRALRMRDILLGVAVSKFDYFVVFDEYGRNSYLSVLSWLQVVFGPTPYAMRMVNAVIFTGGSLLLFREARRAFGWLPAYLALLVMLFYPTLFVWSISLLKEPLYLLGTSLVLVSAIRLLQQRAWMERVWPALGVAAGLAIIADLRPGALAVAASGLIVGIALREATRSTARVALAATLVLAAAAAVVLVPALERRTIAALVSTAKQQAGHVFTVGHAYKTLDDGFYMTPQTPLTNNMTLTPDQAARYVVRSLVSFVVVPVPWQIASPRELAYLPEQFAWYAMVGLAPFGIRRGWRRDPIATALLVGYILPTAAALALTNGNVGTMVRLRGVLIPYLAVLAAVGCCDVLEAMASRGGARDPGSSLAGLEGIRS